MDVLKFCRYLDQLKHLPRTGWIRHGISKPETVACHMYRMAMLAWMIDCDKVDKIKCLKMALIHDVGEAIIGDITPHCGVSDADKFDREQEAVDSVSATLPETSADEVKRLWLEYEEAKTAEAILVKDLDKFDMIAQAYEYEMRENKPRFLQEFFDSTVGVFRTPSVIRWVETLYQEREKKH